jgi:hypothetical protein
LFEDRLVIAHEELKSDVIQRAGWLGQYDITWRATKLKKVNKAVELTYLSSNIVCYCHGNLW